MTLHLFGNLLNLGWIVLVFHLKAFYFIRHSAFILRVLLWVEWLQGGSASTSDGDSPLCVYSLVVCSCYMDLILWLCLVFLFVLSEVHSLSQETRVSWFILVITFSQPSFHYRSSLYHLVVSLPALLHIVWHTGNMGCCTCLLLAITHVDLFISSHYRLWFNWNVTTGVLWPINLVMCVLHLFLCV